MRTCTIPATMTVTYLLGDHLGSTSLSTDAAGTVLAETKYKACPSRVLREGEERFTTPNSTLPTRYTFTGQYSYVSDDATGLGAAGFGLMYYNARWYDPYLSRFAQADTVVPGAGDSQAWDRYAYTNNNPLKYTDPTGHVVDRDGGGAFSMGVKWWEDRASRLNKISPLLPHISGSQLQGGVNIGWTFGHPYKDKSMTVMIYYSLNLVTDENGGVQLFYTKRDMEFVKDFVGSHLGAGEAESAFPSIDYSFSFFLSRGVIGGRLFEKYGTEAYEGETIDYQGGLGPVGADFYVFFDKHTREIKPGELWGADLSASAGAPIGFGEIAQQSVRITNRIQLPLLISYACKVAGYCGGLGLP